MSVMGCEVSCWLSLKSFGSQSSILLSIVLMMSVTSLTVGSVMIPCRVASASPFSMSKNRKCCFPSAASSLSSRMMPDR